MQSIPEPNIITKMQMNLNLNTAMTKALVGMVKEYVTEVTTELSKIYGFPLEEAIQKLGLENLQVSEKKGETKKREKKGPLFMLPYCGVTCESWCKAVKYNSGLMTQCTKKPESNKEYCKMCAKTMDETGKPKFGSMHDRDKEGWTDPSGKSPVRYVSVMSKIKVDGVAVTEEQVKEEADKMGWTIPDEEFILKEEDTTDKKQRGRPKKSKPMTTSGSVGDDMIANLVSQAKLQEDTSSEMSGSDSDHEVPAADTKSKKVNKNDSDDKAKKELEKKEKEAKKEAEKKEKEAKKEAEKKEKEAKKELEKKEKEAKKESEKKEKEAKKKGKKGEEDKKENEEKAMKEATQIAEDIAKKKAEQILSQKLEEGELSEEDEEEEINVTKFTFEGKDYLRDDKNVLYDYESQDEIGIWTGEKIELYES